MEKELRLGMMGQDTKEVMSMERSKGKECIHGLMNLAMMENGGEI